MVGGQFRPCLSVVLSDPAETGYQHARADAPHIPATKEQMGLELSVAVLLAEIPAGVIVNDEGELCDNQGVPLPRGLRLSPDGKSLVVGLSGTPLPKGERTVACRADTTAADGCCSCRCIE